MPDSKPYRDSPGFIETDNGIVADPSVAGSAGDYNSWDWKQIMAAIIGGSAMAGDGGNALSHGLVDPQTLWDAGRAFDKVKNTLQMVGKSISDQAKALAGPDGPWKGDAATAFMTLMDKFSQQVLANAERFSGGDAGINPVGTQLWNMGNQLSYAQYEIHAIDQWYAHQASLVGASTMDNGLIHIGDKKYDKIREMMTRDMRQVLHDLADKYSAVKVNPPAAGGGGSGQGDPPPYKPEPGPGPGDGPGGDGGGDGGPNPDDFNFDKGPGPGDGTGGPQPQAFEGGPQPQDFQGGDGGPQPQDFPGGDGPQAKDFPGGDGPQAQDFPGGGPQDFQGGGDAPALDGPQQPGGDGTGGPGSPAPMPFPGMGGLNNGGGAKDTGGSPDIKPFPGRGSGPGSGGTGDLGDFKPTEFPGMGTNGMGDLPAVNEVAPPSQWGAGEMPDGAQLPDNRGGAPMPPMTGMPMGQGGSGGAAERPDSAGLLDGGVEPWKGGVQPPIGNPSELDTPSSNPADWAAPGLNDKGVQMPGMPGMPMGQGSGMGGGAGGTAAERPDSAGLLDGGVEPWQGGELPGGDPTGVDAPALNPADWAVPGDSGKGVQVPGMPGMPTTGGAGGGTSAERPDSAGLLDGGAEPWTGADVPGGDPAGVDAPTMDPAAWAAPGTDKGVQASGMPGMPMSPTTGGAGGGTPAERPDSAGLLDGGTEPWTGADLPSGDPQGVAAPALDPAAWAVPETDKGVQAPGMPMFPITGGAGGGTSAERPDSAALLDGGTEPWTPAELVTPTPEPAPWSAPPENPPGVPLAPGAGSLVSIVDGTPEPVDRVAVVAQPDGREDTSSWNTGGAGFLTLLWPHGAPKDDQQGEEEIATDYVLRDTEPWTPTPDPAEYATWQPKKQGDGLPPVEEVAERRPSCTDLGEVPAAPVEETEESEKDKEVDEEEETSRSMSDLLKQDNSAWGGGNTKPSGVLE